MRHARSLLILWGSSESRNSQRYNILWIHTRSRSTSLALYSLDGGAAVGGAGEGLVDIIEFEEPTQKASKQIINDFFRIGVIHFINFQMYLVCPPSHLSLEKACPSPSQTRSQQQRRYQCRCWSSSIRPRSQTLIAPPLHNCHHRE